MFLLKFNYLHLRLLVLPTNHSKKSRSALLFIYQSSGKQTAQYPTHLSNICDVICLDAQMSPALIVRDEKNVLAQHTKLWAKM